MEGDRAFQPFDLSDISWLLEPVDRIGPGGLIYQGSLHWLQGEPESGKSFLAYWLALGVMRDGGNVLILDEEAGPRDALSKLFALGAELTLLKERLTYLEPAGRDLPRRLPEFVALVNSIRPCLVILDSAAGHLAAAGADEDRSADVTPYLTRVLLPLAHRAGASVIVIDHMTKTASDSRYARGSGAKLAKTDVGFRVEAIQPFSKGHDGRLRITCVKDRHGEHGRGATWDVQVLAASGTVDLVLTSLSDDEALAARRASKQRPITAQERRVQQITAYLTDSVIPQPSPMIGQVLGIDRPKLSAALNEMERRGVAFSTPVPGERTTKQWQLIRGDAP